MTIQSIQDLLKYLTHSFRATISVAVETLSRRAEGLQMCVKLLLLTTKTRGSSRLLFVRRPIARFVTYMVQTLSRQQQKSFSIYVYMTLDTWLRYVTANKQYDVTLSYKT
jgi:hypothetical protein